MSSYRRIGAEKGSESQDVGTEAFLSAAGLYFNIFLTNPHGRAECLRYDLKKELLICTTSLNLHMKTPTSAV